MTHMSENRKLPLINLAAFSVMLLVNLLAELLPIGGRTTREISALFPSPLTPAPYAFSIWGLIYLLLLLTLVLRLLQKESMGVPDEMGIWFVISCAANTIWLFFWHMLAMGPALLAMLILLISLMMTKARMQSPAAGGWKQLVPHITISLYYGWITVAAIANIGVWLQSIGFSGFGLPMHLLQTLVILAGGIIIFIGIRSGKDPAYGIAALWGYIGIFVAQITRGIETGFAILPMTALVICCVAFISAIFPLLAAKLPMLQRQR